MDQKISKQDRIVNFMPTLALAIFAVAGILMAFVI